MSCRVVSCLVLSCLVIVLSCLRDFLSCRRLVLSCHRLVLFCHRLVLSCHRLVIVIVIVIVVVVSLSFRVFVLSNKAALTLEGRHTGSVKAEWQYIAWQPLGQVPPVVVEAVIDGEAVLATMPAP